MTRLGFKKNNIELCLYTHGEGEIVAYLLMYVDDLLICSKNKRKIQRVKKLLTNRFEMKDLDEVKEYLGINIDYDYCIFELSRGGAVVRIRANGSRKFPLRLK